MLPGDLPQCTLHFKLHYLEEERKPQTFSHISWQAVSKEVLEWLSVGVTQCWRSAAKTSSLKGQTLSLFSGLGPEFLICNSINMSSRGTNIFTYLSPWTAFPAKLTRSWISCKTWKAGGLVGRNIVTVYTNAGFTETEQVFVCELLLAQLLVDLNMYLVFKVTQPRSRLCPLRIFTNNICSSHLALVFSKPLLLKSSCILLIFSAFVAPQQAGQRYYIVFSGSSVFV